MNVCRVREVRLELKISQDRLARAGGVTREAIRALERGHSEPSVYTAIRIARFLDRPLEELFEPNGNNRLSAVAEMGTKPRRMATDT